MDKMIYCLIIYLVECFGWLTQILEVRESDVEEEQHLDEGNHAQERGEEEAHPADGLAADTPSQLIVNTTLPHLYTMSSTCLGMLNSILAKHFTLGMSMARMMRT